MQAYQWAKTRAEQLSFQLGDDHGLQVFYAANLVPVRFLCRSRSRSSVIRRWMRRQVVSVVPTCILGPPQSSTMRSNSLDLVRGWLAGEGKVQTRLVCDVRDVAKLHIAAASYRPLPGGQPGPIRRHQRRFIAGTEQRVPAEKMRACLAQGAKLAGLDATEIRSCRDILCHALLPDPDKTMRRARTPPRPLAGSGVVQVAHTGHDGPVCR